MAQWRNIPVPMLVTCFEPTAPTPGVKMLVKLSEKITSELRKYGLMITNDTTTDGLDMLDTIL